ncbi:cobalt-zinc-cadmium efflux system protein [Bacillus ectoiniformans]|uniref:cation diffusion facilitator family transporter n=1 Tax=Bacillus ectoiniformans TaxID=1494429 RepID=UPI0019596538|nr:cation diffusion facilitator family transporter [Bacillus ectoiniformans]MBM7649009.1 cobalt-zinc-cadmium efflux system protein [Bacillus ectoiniformans]
MGHGHSHHHHGHDHFKETREGNKRGLLIALLITAGIMLLEFFGGLLTNSLALLSDAGHMLSDSSSLFLSLIAIWFASKSASPTKSFGFYRFEILAALFNGVTLFIIAGLIIWEAYGRFFDPPAVASGSMILIAFIGLAANLVSAWLLMRKGDVNDNVNVKSAYLHILGDALGSAGAIIAGIVMMMTSWYAADPIISGVVALLILKSAWAVIKESLHILMEGSPHAVHIQKVKAALTSIDGVKNIHDLHIWTITSGFDSLSCHLLIEDDKSSQQVLQEAINRIKAEFHIEHTTIQIEKSKLQHSECPA